MPHSVSPVRLTGAVKRFGATLALNGLDLEIAPGGVTALLGPNGAGKTTAIGLMLGRLRPDAGEALLFGRDPRDLAARQRIGVMLQSAGLPQQLTVMEQVMLFAGYYEAAMPAAEAVALAGLGGLERRRCSALSGGQQRRLQFALAIVGRPDMLVLDEPSVGLDLEARRALWTTIRALRDRGATVLLTTHHLEEAEALADRVVVIDKGRVRASGSVADMKALVSGRSIRCLTALDDAALAALPGVRQVSRSGRHVVLLSEAGEATMRALLAADAGVADLQLTGAGLEEAFDALVAEAA
ncbi:Vitamin B12 import ATP-binding protein BtuD [Alphaproteobacteria bacterium SO-S41]|nr:Vitamin B12 import ATP-binding protein BtuD [Alphaproteobacteria bacterium SO-S41]